MVYTYTDTGMHINNSLSLLCVCADDEEGHLESPVIFSILYKPRYFQEMLCSLVNVLARHREGQSPPEPYLDTRTMTFLNDFKAPWYVEEEVKHTGSFNKPVQKQELNLLDNYDKLTSTSEDEGQEFWH